jgi:hypothetical protein
MKPALHSFQNPIETQTEKNEYRCKDSQQNTSKQNSATHQKDHTP